MTNLKQTIGGRDPPAEADGQSALRWPVWPQLKQAPLEPEERKPPEKVEALADSPEARLGQSNLRCPG